MRVLARAAVPCLWTPPVVLPSTATGEFPIDAMNNASHSYFVQRKPDVSPVTTADVPEACSTRGIGSNSAGRGIACLSRFDHGERAWNSTSKIVARKVCGAANFHGSLSAVTGAEFGLLITSGPKHPVAALFYGPSDGAKPGLLASRAAIFRQGNVSLIMAAEADKRPFKSAIPNRRRKRTTPLASSTLATLGELDGGRDRTTFP